MRNLTTAGLRLLIAAAVVAALGSLLFSETAEHYWSVFYRLLYGLIVAEVVVLAIFSIAWQLQKSAAARSRWPADGASRRSETSNPQRAD